MLKFNKSKYHNLEALSLCFVVNCDFHISKIFFQFFIYFPLVHGQDAILPDLFLPVHL